MKSASHGFTLVELLITLTVGAIVLGMATPSFVDMVKNYRLTAHANLFVTAMNLARGEAVKRGVNVTVEPRTGTDWTSGFRVTAGVGDLFTREFPADGNAITFTSDGDFEEFVYQPSGRISVAAGDTITLCDDRTGEVGRQITVSGTGRVSVTRIDC